MKQNSLSSSEVLKAVPLLDRDRLNGWVRAGLIKPLPGKRRKYVEEDVPLLRRVSELVRLGFSAPKAFSAARSELSSGSLGSASKPKRLLETVPGKAVHRWICALIKDRAFAETRLAAWARAQPSEAEWSRIGQAERPPLSALRDLDQLPYRAVRSLAETMGIHGLLMDPLFSAVEQQTANVLSLYGDFVRVGEIRDAHYGFGAQYYVAERRLGGNDAAFGRLDLEPGGRSDEHTHPGSEVLFVLEGEVVSLLPDRSIRNVLKKGDLAHYHSDQCHLVVNHSESNAKVLVIRFYQLREGVREYEAGVIQSFRTQVADVVSSAAGRGESPTLNATQIELIEMVAARLPRQSEDEQFDWVALGRFLYVARKSSRETPESNETKRAEAGLPPPPIDANQWLERISKIYDIERVILEAFRVTPLGGYASVRGIEAPEKSRDLRGIEVADLQGGAEYWAPKWNLGHSDMQISVVKLPAGGTQTRTPLNWHPGFEFLLPMRGKCTVNFQQPGQKPEQFTASASLHQCIHYPSGIPHYVEREGDDETLLLVVRFFSSSAEWIAAQE